MKLCVRLFQTFCHLVNEMKKQQTFGSSQWLYESEKIERLPAGTYSFGIGQDLMLMTGLPVQQILAKIADVFDKPIDGGADVGFMNQTRCYIHRRGKAVDIGTRTDFADLGWTDICDACDKSCT